MKNKRTKKVIVSIAKLKRFTKAVLADQNYFNETALLFN